MKFIDEILFCVMIELSCFWQEVGAIIVGS